MKTALKATALGLLFLLLAASSLYFHLQARHHSQKHALVAAKNAKLQAENETLRKQIDNLLIQNEDLAQLLRGEKHKLAKAEKQTTLLQKQEHRLKQAVEEASLQASAERTAFLQEREKLETALQKKEAKRQSLEEKLKIRLESQNVVISRLEDHLKVNLASKILFSSGSSTLLPQGKKILSDLALTLEKEADQIIRVEGHTDDIPIRQDGSLRFPTNWELSSGRAIAAIRYLEEVCGIPGDRLSAIAYGQTRPVVPNDSPENRAKNRRIEIILTPK